MYVDESGDSGLVGSPTRYFVLTGMVVHELRWHDALPACVWQEFEMLSEHEAAELAPHIKCKVRMKKPYLVGGAAIADSLNPGFPMSPFDEKTDYYAASICSIEGYTLMTTSSQMKEYVKMHCCTVIEVYAWSANPAPGQK